MPLDSTILGKSTRRRRTDVDARWLMAYAAALGERAPQYFDTTQALATHPVFPVCIEWPAVIDAGSVDGSGLTFDESRRGVHATHDLRIHRPIRAGDELYTSATVVGVEQRPSGGYQMLRLDTVDAAGAAVCTTYQGNLLRGIEVEGVDRWIDEPEPPPIPPEGSLFGARMPLEVPAGLAHVYSECARIWNPVHTDHAVAIAAGLPGIILHGTATLALAASALVREFLDDEPARIGRLACRFSAMVPVPTTLSLHVTARLPGAIWFEVTTREGSLALRDGFCAYN